jgi:hypothetical protein
MWLYTFKSQLVSVTKEVVTKGVIIKGGLLYLHHNNNNSELPPKVPKFF